jgi:titin
MCFGRFGFFNLIGRIFKLTIILFSILLIPSIRAKADLYVTTPDGGFAAKTRVFTIDGGLVSSDFFGSALVRPLNNLAFDKIGDVFASWGIFYPNTNYIGKYDAVTGQAKSSQFINTGFSLGYLALNNSNELYSASGKYIAKYDSVTGVGSSTWWTSPWMQGVSDGVTGLAVRPNGNGNPYAVYTMTPSGQQITVASFVSLPSGVPDLLNIDVAQNGMGPLAVDLAGDYAYIVLPLRKSVAKYDISNGDIVNLDFITGFSQPSYIASDIFGSLYVADGSVIKKYDAATGAVISNDLTPGIAGAISLSPYTILPASQNITRPAGSAISTQELAGSGFSSPPSYTISAVSPSPGLDAIGLVFDGVKGVISGTLTGSVGEYVYLVTGLSGSTEISHSYITIKISQPSAPEITSVANEIRFSQQLVMNLSQPARVTWFSFFRKVIGGSTAARRYVSSMTSVQADVPETTCTRVENVLVVEGKTEGECVVTATIEGPPSSELTKIIAVSDFAQNSLPYLTNVDPAVSITAGNVDVSITGGNLADATSVLFDGIPAESFTVESDTEILAKTPAHPAGRVKVGVYAEGGAGTAEFDYVPPGPDAPTGFIAAPGNSQVTLNWTAPQNTGGSPITAYSVSGTPGGSCTTNGATNCVVTGLTNGTAYTFALVASNAGGASQPVSSNTVTPEAALNPLVFSVSPSTGSQSGGTPVTITGSNLTGASQVLFDQTPATSVTVNSANQITAVSPAHEGGAVDITVVTPAGQDALELSYTYDAPPATPGTPIPAAGDRQVNVSWPQVLTGGGDPVSYTVTASPGGQTCSVPFPGQAYPYASCVVTGLTNGTAYTFRVQATNALGNATSGPSVPATPQAVLNGACGAANGIATLVPPAGLLCGTGTASAVSSSNGNFTWSCTGTNGGSTAQCEAPGAASQGSQTGSTAFTTETAANGCNLQSARLISPPNGGPSATNMPYGVVNFEMVSCTGNAARVRMTYAGIVEGMQFWKYVFNSYHTGWTQIPSNQVTLVGNTAEFTLVDNGEWDNDPTVGAIADPGGPGYDPNALVAPGQPVNVTATAGNRSATVNWQVPASGSQPVRYVVAALINGVPTGQTCEATWPATSCTVQGLTNGTAYTFTVTAENGAGNGAAGVVVTPVTPRPNPVPPPNPIPTLGPFGLVGLSSLLTGVAGWRQRRRTRNDRNLNG